MKLDSGSNLLYHAAFHIKYVFTYSNNLFITWLIQAFVNVAFSLQNELKQLFFGLYLSVHLPEFLHYYRYWLRGSFSMLSPKNSESS